MVPLLIVTPLESEFAALAAALADQGSTLEDRPIGKLPGLADADKRFMIAQGGLGKSGFALRVQHLMEHLHDVSLVVCAGAAGSLSKAPTVGDVVVGTQTVEHDFYRKFRLRPPPRFDGDEASLAILRGIDPMLGTGSRVHFGPVASGDEDIVDPVRARELHQSTGALAVAWEGAGGARACEFNNVRFLEVRGISDSADQAAAADFASNLPLAMRNVASVLIRLAETVPPPTLG
jgi:adenosylhomocysteine nucleosidase